MVALLPETNENATPEFPKLFGFHVLFLPYLDDIRTLDYEVIVGGTESMMQDGSRSVREIWRADAEQIEVAKAIIKKMSMRNGYVPTLFENPALQTKLRIIEAVALEKDIQQVDDTTQPNVEAIDDRLGPRAGKFVDLVFPIGCHSQTSASKAKPKLSGEEAEQAVESAARNGTVSFIYFNSNRSILTLFCNS